MLAGLALNYGALRQAPQALAAFDRALAVSPQDTDLLAGKAEVYTHSGDLDAAERLLQPIAFATAAPGVFGTKMQLLLLQRRFEDAIAGIQANAGRAEFADPINSANLDTELGMLQIFAGRPQAAQAPCTRALNTLQSLSATAADDADLGLLLASADYCLGRTAEAARIARRWMELNAGDALDFSKKGTVVVLAELAAGQDEDAYTLLAQLLQKPGGPTGADLRQNPYWDPVRKDPRFQKLLEAPVGS
jgi:tetratricopeptide (TPR) repeat protein